MSRDATEIVTGGPAKTCTFPRTVLAVCSYAFADRKELQSVQFNNGVTRLEEGCFVGAGVRRLVLPSSVRNIGSSAFEHCGSLELADLRAARRLKGLGEGALGACKKLRRVLLGDGLGEISACFMCSAVEKIVIPAGVRVIQAKAFNSCERLRRVAFAGDGPEAIKLYAFASSGLESFRPSIAAQAREPGLRELFRIKVC